MTAQTFDDHAPVFHFAGISGYLSHIFRAESLRRLTEPYSVL